MRTFPLITSYLFLLTLPALALTDAWPVDISRHASEQRTYKQGESIDITVTLRDGLKPLDTTGMSAAFYWYTNSVDNLWWTNSASIITHAVTFSWTPAMDTGAASYPFWVGLWPAGSTSPVWRVTGQIRLLPSPGFTPNALVPPVRTLDFAAITVTNAPWLSVSDWQSGSNALASALQTLSTNTAAQLSGVTGAQAQASAQIESNRVDLAAVPAATTNIASVLISVSTGGLASAASVSALQIKRWYDSDNTNKWATLEGSNIVVREVGVSGTNYTVTLSGDFAEAYSHTRPAWSSGPFPFNDGIFSGTLGETTAHVYAGHGGGVTEWSGELAYPDTVMPVTDGGGSGTATLTMQYIYGCTNVGPRYYLSTNTPPAELQNLDALQGWLNNLFYSKAASDARYANASVTNAPSWEIYTNATGLVTVTNHLESPIFIHATGAVSIAISGLRSPLPIVLGVRGFSSLSFPGAYIVGGGSAQTNMSNYFICTTLGTNTLVTPYTCTED